MKKMPFFAGFASFMLLQAGTVCAQERWNTTVSVYLWTPETKTKITTPLGPIETKLSFSDALENLDAAFMGTLKTRRGKISLIGDIVHTDLSFSNATPGPVFGGAQTSVKTTVVNTYALYELQGDEQFALDIGAGLRWFSTDTSLNLLPAGAGAGRAARTNDDWLDPVIAARVRVNINERWSARFFVDYGGFSSTSESWQVVATARYAFNEKWSVSGGYRFLDVSHGPSSNAFEFSQSGPLIGFSYSF